ncbi:MAG: carbohydrate ABC transporter permease [Clostridia bacterium]|nr:carbohydrate ABC transporter permease [Clostridia bacterium]
MKKEKSLKKRPKYIGSYIVMALVILFVFLPLYIMLNTSLQSESEANSSHFHWLPEEWSVLGYVSVFTKRLAGINIMRGFFNTLWIYLPGILVGLYSSSMAAFSYAKIKFKGKGVMFSILLSTIMLPNSMSTISLVLLYDSLGWMNTPYPLMIPPMFGGIGAVFFMRQFYLTIPEDLVNAAKIDGLGYFGVFNRIILPMSGSVLLAQFILSFIGSYNDYMGPLMYCQSSSMYTLQVALAMFAGPYAQNWPLRMAGAVVGMTPLIVLYICCQKFIRKGLSISASIKG